MIGEKCLYTEHTDHIPEPGLPVSLHIPTIHRTYRTWALCLTPHTYNTQSIQTTSQNLGSLPHSTYLQYTDHIPEPGLSASLHIPTVHRTYRPHPRTWALCLTPHTYNTQIWNILGSIQMWNEGLLPQVHPIPPTSNERQTEIERVSLTSAGQCQIAWFLFSISENESISILNQTGSLHMHPKWNGANVMEFLCWVTRMRCLSIKCEWFAE